VRSLIDHSAMMVVGLMSALLAWLLPPLWVGMAGYFCFVIAVYYTVAGFVLGRRERRGARSAQAP
jgi:1,4-dihydroxy-2-naphthoate octaprenyltransferase